MDPKSLYQTLDLITHNKGKGVGVGVYQVLINAGLVSVMSAEAYHTLEQQTEGLPHLDVQYQQTKGEKSRVESLADYLNHVTSL
ncbi:hypothetical protein HZB02_02520 [Candidatus Woesearchaeota archaeon]|nr:hypothetical protein [Candidatus Woesearchaeota archaeon]